MLLSLAPVCRSVTQTEILADSVEGATERLLENQDEAGGWGARRGMRPRLFPTTFSIQALATVAKELDQPISKRCATAIDHAARWIESCQNPKDGGFGLRPGARSNVASAGHAAWGLSVARAEVPGSLRDYILERLEKRLPRSSIRDKVGDPPTSQRHGRYELLIMPRPMALIGAIAAHGHIYEQRVVAVLKAILRRQSSDGAWRVGSGRFVWPTYMCVTALRLWLTVHRSHAQTSTSDFSDFQPGTDLRARREEKSLYERAFPLPPDWEDRVERLSEKQRLALVSDLRRETLQAGAEKMGISSKTMEKHRYAARERLETESVLEMWAIAVAAGLVQDSDRDSWPPMGSGEISS